MRKLDGDRAAEFIFPTTVFCFFRHAGDDSRLSASVRVACPQKVALYPH
jgi:hypothetical protein